ncbi:MAG: hypothetical protein ABIO55_15315 [Ginsengibacter sp.]
MSQPKRRKHPRQTNTPKLQKGIIYHKIIPVAVIIFVLFGIGFSFLITGYNIWWLITGAAIGAVCGFLFGYQIAKVLSKK